MNRNPLFRFVSSVRLAVPLMLVIAGVVAAGTIYESRYNAQVARLVVYQAWWFEALMALLWTNIFCAAVSRFPYKEHHTGFVITHIGLLTLLIGAQITASRGIDGQLRVVEGQSSNQVFLSNLVVKIKPESQAASGGHGSGGWRYALERTLEPRTGDQLAGPNGNDTGVTVDSYLPFVAIGQSLVPAGGSSLGGQGGVAVSFTLRSQFFNVSESLDTLTKPEMQLGPATLRVLLDPDQRSTAASAPARSIADEDEPVTRSAPQGPRLIVKDEVSGRVLESVALVKLRKAPVTVRGVTITLVRAYEQAAVDSGRLAELGQSGANPALELRLDSGGKSIREIAFAKFPTFSLAKAGTFKLRLSYENGATGDLPMQARDGVPPPMGAGRNVIEFHVHPGETRSARVVLLKDGRRVQSRKLLPGDTLDTPWMGMKVTVTAVVPNAVMSEEVHPTQMEPRKPLPPSAIFVRTDLPGGGAGEGGTWIIQGESKRVRSTRGSYEVYYGEDSLELPFTVRLDEFRKVDYPGTETPMSFESTIRLSQGGTPTRIQMNEPLQQDGFVLYQSSYEQGPGMPTASIFSVNRDPGRWTKYAGAVILVLGILILVLMRTKSYGAWRRTWGLKRAGLATAALGVALGLFTSPRSAHAEYRDFEPAAAERNLVEFASHIDDSLIRELPVHSHGRIKPLDSFAREGLLFLTGKYSLFGLSPVQLYLGLVASDSAAYLPIVNIRDPKLRERLGFRASDRYVTLQQMMGSRIRELAEPLMAKQERDEKSLDDSEKGILEVANQVWFLRETLKGALFEQAVTLDLASSATSVELVSEKVRQYLGQLRGRDFSAASLGAIELISAVRSQPMPALFRSGLQKMGVEVAYNRLRLFLWAGVLYMLIGVVLVSGILGRQPTRKWVVAAVGLPLALHAAGFAMRVYITGFAPVTNMYGTMIWMALGVVVFGVLLCGIYRNFVAFGLLLVGSSTTLLLTESIPLILSPDMDPIVAVLRSNFWLTIHVLTISISYAAFTIAMLMGNSALSQVILRRDSRDGLRNLAHLAYRSMQLGVFLLTTGIILGGWWADYSWGRFWGWDPKETWALIADLGFLAILHARHVGWLGAFGTLAAAPVAYLLVVMAWYGVNFILAAGLHSYGFSNGGTAIVIIFVSFQLLLFATGMVSRIRRSPRAS